MTSRNRSRLRTSAAQMAEAQNVPSTMSADRQRAPAKATEVAMATSEEVLSARYYDDFDITSNQYTSVRGVMKMVDFDVLTTPVYLTTVIEKINLYFILNLKLEDT